MADETAWPEEQEAAFCAEFRELCAKYGCARGAYVVSWPNDPDMLAIGGESHLGTCVARGMRRTGSLGAAWPGQAES